MTDTTHKYTDGFIYYSYTDSNGQTKILDFSTLETDEFKDGFTWIHLNRSDKNVHDWLIRDPLIDETVTQSLLADDSRPRATPHGDGVLMSLRGVNLNEGGEPEDMVSVRMWIEPHRIVTVQNRNMRATHTMYEQMQKRSSPHTPGDFVADLALLITTNMGPTISELNDKIDGMEEQVLDSDASSLRTGLGELRREAILFRRYVAPQRDALNTLSFQNLEWITDKDRLRLREASDQTTRIAEELEAVRERAALVYDQLVDKRAEEMNRTMLILAIVAGVFMPLGLIAGMMGMNVGGMPLLESPFGFWVTSGVILLTGFLTVILFKVMKWM